MIIEKITQELKFSENAKNIQKDILIVVHNQYEYVRNCLESIYKNTNNFNLFIWNNNSDEQTTNYLENISKNKKNVKLYNSEKNFGFIIPNNIMIKDSTSDFIILLNSDTKVLPEWDNILLGYLINNSEVLVVGYSGGILNENGVGVSSNWGKNIDYINGYCMCFSKKTYQEFKLFDEENLEFAYCEDSDFCLRIREKNKKVYACYSNLVIHYGSKTTNEVMKKYNFSSKINKNLSYFQKRWSNYLKNKSF
jgi:GT2 family glycosyltransferase